VTVIESVESVDAIRAALEALVRQRQQLRALDSGPTALELNRGAIVRRQWQLAAALIARHGSPKAA
jgi:hypothetical protein